MTDLCRYARHPFAFLGRYIAMRRVPHAIILVAVLAAVACSVSSQYGIKVLVDALSAGPTREPDHLVRLPVPGDA